MRLISQDHPWTSWAMIVVFFSYSIAYPCNMLLLELPGWIWNFPERNHAMEHMLVATYGTLGLFFLYGARDPVRYLPLIDFTIIANIAHATTMLVDANRMPGHAAHLMLFGDVLGTYFVPMILILFHPRRFYLDGLFSRGHE